MTTTSEHKRHKKVTGALNGEIRVVSKNLNNAGYDKTQTQRIEEAVGKVESLAAREPDLETKMTQHLQEEKERGNLSFSKDEDFINTSDNHDLTTLSKDSITTAGATTGEQSKCALLCEAINALERGKQAYKELNFANQMLQDQAHSDKNKEGKIMFENQLILQMLSEMHELR